MSNRCTQVLGADTTYCLQLRGCVASRHPALHIETTRPQTHIKHCTLCLQQLTAFANPPHDFLPSSLGAAPTGSTPPYPPPVLSVEPSDGWVKHGGTLSFTCSLPDLLQQPRSTRHTPVSFLLLRTSTSTGSLQPIRASHPESGVFHLGPVRGGEDGQYTCLYQVAGQMTPVNSTVSNTVQVSVQGEDASR